MLKNIAKGIGNPSFILSSHCAVQEVRWIEHPVKQ